MVRVSFQELLITENLTYQQMFKFTYRRFQYISQALNFLTSTYVTLTLLTRG